MTVFQLTFLLPYVISIRAEKADPSKLKNFLMVILGFFAGCSNEAGGLATIFLTAIFIFIAARKKFFKSWMLFGFATLILGALICILAPGNFAQTEYIRSVNPAFNFSAELLKNNFLEGFLPVLYLDLAAILPTIIYFFKRDSIKADNSDIIILSFAAAGLIVHLAMIFFWGNQINYVIEHRQEKTIYLPPLTPTQEILQKIHGFDCPASNLKYFGGLTANKNNCINILIAQYYGAKYIVAENRD